MRRLKKKMIPYVRDDASLAETGAISAEEMIMTIY
jgi:hypothetical protein